MSTDRFAPGVRVRTRATDPAGHTRLPRYARGVPADPQPVWHVRFAAADLFGTGDHTVTVELWQDYLTPIEEAL